jgi:hypothetical protein
VAGRQAGEAREPRFLRSSGSTLDRHKKRNPEQSILGAYSSLCLWLFCPATSGCRGTGVSRRKGLLALASLPTRPRLSLTASTFWAISKQSRRIGRNSRRSISPAEPLWCLIGGRTIRMGKRKTYGEEEDLKKLLFVFTKTVSVRNSFFRWLAFTK